MKSILVVALSLLAGLASAEGRKVSTTTYPNCFVLLDSADHVSRKTGLSPACKRSKNGGASASCSGSISEVSSSDLPGVYCLAGNATDRDTVGVLALNITASGADPRAFEVAITTADPFIYPDTSSTIAAVTTVTTTTTATTCTNLTNAASAGDFTSTMKTSLNNSTPACASVSARVSADVDRVDGAALGTHSAGYFPADVRHFGGSAGAFSGGRAEVNTTHFGGSAGTFSTGLPTVLLSSGTGTGQLSLSSGAVTLTAAYDAAKTASQAGDVMKVSSGTGANQIDLASGHVKNVDTLTTYTGNTPQTGDAFARLGAPAGASIAADIAGIPAANWLNATRTLTACSFCVTALQVENAVWDATAASHATAGTTGAAISSGSAPTASQNAAAVWGALLASYTTAGTMGYNLNLLDDIYSHTSTIGGATIIVTSPLLDSDDLELVAGDAYDLDHSRALDDFALTGFSTLAGSTVKLVIDGVLEVTATSITNVGTATQTPIFELTALQTALLTRKGAKAYRFQIQATWAADTPAQPAVLAQGYVSVVKRASVL